jgi:predicted permease
MRGRQLEDQLDAELRDHLERRVTDLTRGGMPEAEARRAARLEFGGLDQVKEECRDARGTRWIDELGQDLRYGVRMLVQSPAFTTVAVLSLALGIGANTAIFSLVNSLLLRGLPVPAAERLVILEHGSWTNPIWEQIRERQAAFAEQAAAFSYDRFDVGKDAEARFVEGLWVSGDFFETLGVPAMLGRAISSADDDRGGGRDGDVAVISHAYWQDRFGGSPDAIGRTITLNRMPFTIIGVMPPNFRGPVIGRAFDVAVPIAAVDRLYHAQGDHQRLDGRSNWWLDIMARLKPGQTIEQATAALRALQPAIREATLPPRWRPEDLKQYLSTGLTLVPAAGGRLPGSPRDRYRQPLLIVMAVVALVLLIACANIANLLLARASERRHELSMRRALGASGFRLARQLLTESLLLSLAGAALGVAFAGWASRLLLRQISSADESIFVDLSLDWRVLLFVTIVASGTALLFGIAPALRAARTDPQEALKEHGRSLVGEGRRALGTPLVILQVALSLVLVAAAGLFVRSFSTLATLDLGFDRSGLLLVNIDTQRTGLEGADLPLLLDRVRGAAQAVPGVESAAVATISPISGAGWNNIFEIPGAPRLAERERSIFINALSPGWFGTYGTRLISGRDFSAADSTGGLPVAIVNEAFVRKYMPGQNPLGRTMRQIARPGEQQPLYEIVGLAEDAAYRSVREPVPATVYFPITQAADDLPPFATLTVRVAAGPPAAHTRSLTAALERVNPNLSLTFRPLAEQVDASLVRERIVAMLSGFFGTLALLLAGIGLYGVTSYAVSRRRTEIGIRMALGADARGVVALVLRRVALLVSVGIAAGTLASLWAGRFVNSLLYGLEAQDAVMLAGAAALLCLIAGLAAWMPARRAARIDPAEILREG